MAIAGQVPQEPNKPGSDGGLAGAEPLSPGSGAGEILNPTVAVHLLDLIGEGVALATRSGQIIWANEFIKRLGSAMVERLATACRQFDKSHPMPPADIAPPTGVSRTAMVEGERWFDVRISPAPGVVATDRRDHLLVVVCDTSAANRLQQRIDAIDQAGSDLMRFDADLIRRSNAHERLKLVESRIVEIARNLLHFDHLAIRLLDERTGRLELVIAYNLPSEFDAFEIRPALEGHGISGFVAASGRSYICDDVANDPLYLPGVEGARSSLTVPLRLQDRIIGVMNVESERPAAFSEEDRQLAEIFARSVALALHMLDLLVVERSSTNQSITGRVANELREPIEDIAHEVEILRTQLASHDAGAAAHLERITSDLASIRERLLECAAGPSSLLGVEKALSRKGPDPVIAGKRVLVADDEARIRKTIADVLSARGAKVTVCQSGAEAIRTMQEAGAGSFDVVLSDIRMPDHNGYEVFAAARKSLPGVPVILMTGFGYDPHHSIVRASQEGLQTVLFKPFQVERLLEEVRKAVTGARK